MKRAATKTRKVRTFRSGVYLEGLMAELDRAAISLRLAQAREQAGLSQGELAELLELHFRSVQNYESPKVDRVPWDRIDEWASITGVTKEWLLHGDEMLVPVDRERFEGLLGRLEELVALLERQRRDALGG